MKFAFLGYDFAINTLYRLLNEDHELTAIYSFPCDNVFNFNSELQKCAKNLNIPFTETPITQANIKNNINEGTELFLSIGYLYKIPEIDENEAKAVNIHPSFLPAGRGLMPLPHIIINHPEAAGITAHKTINRVDAGDILVQKPLPLNDDETVETLATRIALAMPDMVAELLKDLPSYWNHAVAQDETKASLFPPPDDAMRTINWQDSVKKIKTLHRAFGKFGVLFSLENKIWAAYSLSGWEEPHNHINRTCIHITPREIVIAAADGYICITQADQLTP
jgi:methionyl-tRNA formyltransferase